MDEPLVLHKDLFFLKNLNISRTHSFVISNQTQLFFFFIMNQATPAVAASTTAAAMKSVLLPLLADFLHPQSVGHGQGPLQQRFLSEHLPVEQQPAFEHLHLHFEQFFGHLQPSEQQAEPALHFPLAQQDFPLQAHTTAAVAQQSSGHLQPSTQPVQPAVHFPVAQQFFPLHIA